MKSVTICCEGPACNGGISAKDREDVIVRQRSSATAEMREEAHLSARGQVTRVLAVTPHTFAGTTFHAMTMFTRFACTVCGYARVYGNGSAF